MQKTLRGGFFSSVYGLIKLISNQIHESPFLTPTQTTVEVVALEVASPSSSTVVVVVVVVVPSSVSYH